MVDYNSVIRYPVKPHFFPELFSDLLFNLLPEHLYRFYLTLLVFHLLIELLLLLHVFDILKLLVHLYLNLLIAYHFLLIQILRVEVYPFHQQLDLLFVSFLNSFELYHRMLFILMFYIIYYRFV